MSGIISETGSRSGVIRAFPVGHILQVVSTAKTDKFSMSGSSFVAISGLTATIQPKSSYNKVLVAVSIGRCSPNIAVGATVSLNLLAVVLI